MQEKRQYVRMKTVFPVEFEVLNERGESQSQDLLQGFSRDVSQGGLCIEYKSLQKTSENAFAQPGTFLSLTINPPFSLHPIQAKACVAWSKTMNEILPARYLIGIRYTQIDEKARKRLLAYAKRLIWVPRIAALLGVILLGTAFNLFLNEQKLLQENKRLVTQIIQNAEKKSDVASKLVELQKVKSRLSENLASAHQKIENLQSRMELIKEESEARRQAYQKELDSSRALQKDLSERLKNIETGQTTLQADFKAMERAERVTASAALHQMVDWIGSHRNLKTGLVGSFEGDPALENMAFTYDLSLVCQVFLLFGDSRSAAQILTFYDQQAETRDGAYFNAYSTKDGAPLENIIHVGPNVWIGIAALQYEHRVQDKKFLGLARRIGDWLISQQDPEGGLRGGPELTWYSTEHNLDAYAYFGMLYQLTTDQKYKAAQEKVFSWIRKYAYSVTERRMNRGKGDATIATDTFSWAVAAIGPEKLKQFDFDAEAIMEFAENHCKVTVSYQQPGGKAAKATGFDFAKAQNIGRGGIISTEWTSQMIVSYQMLSRYFEKIGNLEKSAVYRDKATFYLSELQKLFITSPSKIGKGRGCLPYASVDNAETGHGWRTPKGLRTGSVAGTAYGIFAWTGFNPFDLESQIEVEKA